MQSILTNSITVLAYKIVKSALIINSSHEIIVFQHAIKPRVYHNSSPSFQFVLSPKKLTT